MRIGLDFDNTIADYDALFSDVARLSGIETNAKNKVSLKTEILNLPNGEKVWQQVQGATYGAYISNAVLFPGVAEFVFRARLRGHDLFIVSHKTEFGHFDSSHTPLRTVAKDWLNFNEIVGSGPHQIDSEKVFFLNTRDEKISLINDLQLDVFIDDLEEVLLHESFPISTKRIRFGEVTVSKEVAPKITVSSLKSWDEIAREIFGDCAQDEVLSIARSIWPMLEVNSVKDIHGRGNSRIFKMDSPQGSMALKIYPNVNADKRPRRVTEWAALEFLNERKFPVANRLATSLPLNWSTFGWIDGENIELISDTSMNSASKFVSALKLQSRSIHSQETFEKASEACLSPLDLEKQIIERRNRLIEIENFSLQSFIKNKLDSTIEVTLAKAKADLGKYFDLVLDNEFLILSPSDFGFHNAIISEKGHLTYIDFEYFGWDDPVKLVLDFCLHPGMNLSTNQKRWWISEMKKVFIDDELFTLRASSLFSLYVIKWTQIILNEFLPEKIANRVRARSSMEYQVSSAQEEQLSKASTMLNQIERQTELWS